MPVPEHTKAMGEPANSTPVEGKSYPHTDDTQISMGGFKTISLSDVVYRKLRAEKQAGESFADVIERLLASRQPPLTKHLGAWKPMTEGELREIRERLEHFRHGTPAR